MSSKIQIKPNVELGVVATHFRFVGGVVPGADGKFPRDSNGELLTISEIRKLREACESEFSCVQLSIFNGSDEAEVAEMVEGLQAMGLEVHFILMVGGANPMNPADEDTVVSQLVANLKVAVKHGIRYVSSTSIEEWMSKNEVRREGDDFQAAIEQNVKVHLRAYHEAELRGSCVESWNIEFLRPGEFKTFTNVERGWAFVKAMNEALGEKFFELLVDAAHCGDSGLSIAENEDLIARLAAAGEFSSFHASAKTTRGCLSTDDGWIGSLLAAAAKTGKMKHVFVEVFDHEDPALELLRNLDPGHGVDTRDGRSYMEVTADGLKETAHRLNNLKARGILA